MSLAASAMIAAAERVERTGGPGAGLAVWRRLASNASGGALRGRATLAALRCALAVRDETAITDLAALWETVDEGVWEDVFVVCKEMWRAGLRASASALAIAEVGRLRTARALYTYARCLDSQGDPRAPGMFADAVLRADREGAVAISRASRIRRAAWLARDAGSLAEALELAKGIDATGAGPEERLALARVLLRSPSRFVRAGALGLIDDLVTRGRTDVAARALRMAARHADHLGDELTPMEMDRLLAIFARESVAKEARAAREVLGVRRAFARADDPAKDSAALEMALTAAERLDPSLASLHQRARDILDGRFEAHHASSSPSSSSPSSTSSSSSTNEAWSVLLDVVVALRDRAWGRAGHAIHRATELVDGGAWVPAVLWTVASEAFVADDADVRAFGGRLVVAMVSRVNRQGPETLPPPPRGWLSLATALASAGMDDLATPLRRRAALAKEPGAEDALALALTRTGWQLALAGDRVSAVARLREARAACVPRSSATTAAKTVAVPRESGTSTAPTKPEGGTTAASERGDSGPAS